MEFFSARVTLDCCKQIQKKNIKHFFAMANIPVAVYFVLTDFQKKNEYKNNFRLK